MVDVNLMYEGKIPAVGAEQMGAPQIQGEPNGLPRDDRQPRLCPGRPREVPCRGAHVEVRTYWLDK